MSKEPKQQHYIPATYSKNFSDQDGLITICDMRKNAGLFKTQPKSAFKEQYLYTQPVHAESRFDNAIERFFSEEIEAHWSSIVDNISSKRTLSTSDQQNFIHFMLSLRVRVPNTLLAVQELLRSSIKEISDRFNEGIPDLLVEMYEQHHGKREGKIKFSDLVEADFINVNIDPHRAIASMPRLVQSMRPVMDRVNRLIFIHNCTGEDFISSDNPVCFFRAGTSVEKIEPYDVDSKSPFELILTVTPKIALCIDSRRPEFIEHRDTHSKNTVKRINEIVSTFSERFLFGRSNNVASLAEKFKNVCPTPDFERSKVEGGFVQHIAYRRGTPSLIKNRWEYSFTRNKN